jgi:hypothetical protein
MTTSWTGFLRRRTTKEQAKDTGMAVVLILLLVAMRRHQNAYVVAAAIAQVITMAAPAIFRPAAVVWFGLSELVGSIMSRVILAVVFYVVVTPIGLLRKLFGADSLQLRGFKAGRGSVMRERNHTYVGKDIENVY